MRWLGDSAAHGESQSARELEKSQQSSFFHAGGKHEEGVTYKHKKSSILRVVNQLECCAFIFIVGELQLCSAAGQECGSLLSCWSWRRKPERGKSRSHPGAGLAADEEVRASRTLIVSLVI